ncbi:hypothetical protein K8O68_13535 [Salipaludibacillus sp. CUR1]|uniref:DUF4145 domain-containing protein n=1 Tax=Salipaludibacillus sp. CUR1 TaxID=2820003 RepID=UPI001E2D3289|nr:DUF4145 domain-containing protein [Salipaludibacillus sp. CUR1]MCE7793443.1 hypothetical protein [Salipaludibacillus sp. CUR1]
MITIGDINYINDESNEVSSIRTNYDKLPESCPICKKSLHPEYILVHTIDYYKREIMFKCPSSSCGSLFFAVYKENDKYNTDLDDDPFASRFLFEYMYQTKRNDKVFPEEIEEISPDFISIFNQSYHAEQEELNLICGVGYRKALEHLIKDYIINENPSKEDTVKKTHSIQHCINEYIDEADIKEMAERAAWLGNDETHYVREYKDKDIHDLKNLIDITVYFISMKIKAKKYKREIIKRKKVKS